MITPIIEKKLVCEYLDKCNYGTILFLFNHGLGDIVNFLPIVYELEKKYPSIIFQIGTRREEFRFLDKQRIIACPKNIRPWIRTFRHIFIISYPEPVGEFEAVCKPYLCNELEIGIENFIWEPAKIKTNNVTVKRNRVGVHMFGNSSKRKKNLDINQAELLWEAIEDMGYEPFEIHNPKYNEGKDDPLEGAAPWFITRYNSTRFDNLNLSSIVSEIEKCGLFVGIDSGPLYLATALLGTERCIGLEKTRKIERYLPIPMSTISIDVITDELIKDSIYNKEKAL